MNSELKTAVKIVKQAEKLLLKEFKSFGTEADFKKNKEIVTSADLKSNQLITDLLLKNFPNDNIISEEADKIDNHGNDTWYIDPLDGTTNFSYGLKMFAVCLAKTDAEKQIQTGVVGLPAFKEIFYTRQNGFSFLNGQKINVSRPKNHDRKTMIFICGGHDEKSQNEYINLINKIDPRKTRFRSVGCAGMELSSVACGRIDGCALAGAEPWDALAGVLLIRNAGGKVTNFQGDEWTMEDKNIIAGNKHTHEELLKLVA